MDIKTNQHIITTEANTLHKDCPNPKTQIINLVALAIFSGVIAIYAANFLVALPITVIAVTLCSSFIFLISSVAAASLELCNDKIKIQPSKEYKGSLFSKFPEFQKEFKSRNLLTPENAESYKIQVLEAISAKSMASAEETDIDAFIADPLSSLERGMWLLEGERRIASALERLEVQVEIEAQPLVKTFGLESLSQEFTEIYTEYKKCHREISENLERIQESEMQTAKRFREDCESKKEECQLLLRVEIQDAYAFYTKPRRIQDHNLLEDLLKIDLEILSIERKSETPQALEKLELLKNTALSIKERIPAHIAKLYESARSRLDKEIAQHTKACTDKIDEHQTLLESKLRALEEKAKDLIRSAKEKSAADLAKLQRQLKTNFIPKYTALFSS